VELIIGPLVFGSPDQVRRRPSAEQLMSPTWTA
jgi:hypothetical protein